MDTPEGSQMRLVRCTVLAVLILCNLAISTAFALTSGEVLVVYNSRALPDPSSPDYELACQIIPASEGVARYYAEVRNIPSSNVLGLSLLPFTESCNETQYINYIATPISNYLSTHPNIKCIVLCYGIPSWMSVPTSNGRQGIDSTLELLGNDGALDANKLIVSHQNPYYNKNVDFDEFRNSAANTINVGSGQAWKLNYLVCRLDGFGEPTTQQPACQTEMRLTISAGRGILR